MTRGDRGWGEVYGLSQDPDMGNLFQNTSALRHTTPLE